jgi:hypothetical protein
VCTPEKASKISAGIQEDCGIELEIKTEELAERNRILSSILRKNALNFRNIFSVLVTIFNFETQNDALMQGPFNYKF